MSASVAAASVVAPGAGRPLAAAQETAPELLVAVGVGTTFDGSRLAVWQPAQTEPFGRLWEADTASLSTPCAVCDHAVYTCGMPGVSVWHTAQSDDGS